MKLETKLKIASACIVGVMSAIAVVPHFVNASVTDVMTSLRATSARERQYAVLLDRLLDAETGQRGYVITGNNEFLQPYHAAQRALPALLEEMRSVPVTPAERRALDEIERLANAKARYTRDVVRVRTEQGFDAAKAIVDGGQGKVYMDQLRALIGAQEIAYTLQRTELRERLASRSDLAATMSSVATFIDVLLLVALAVAANRGLAQRRQAEQLAIDVSDQLRTAAEISERRNSQLQSGGEMLQALELAETLDEGAQIVALFFGRLLPTLSGSMYLYRNSRDILERKASWGAAPDPEIVEPLDCWALRKGGQHVEEDGLALKCRHSEQAATGMPRMCLPLVTQGNVIGFITVSGADIGTHAGAVERAWVLQLAEQVALALSNVQLRASLRHQSVVDPLTQLYNRRYMDETLYAAKRAGRDRVVIAPAAEHAGA